MCLKRVPHDIIDVIKSTCVHTKPSALFFYGYIFVLIHIND